MGNLVEKGIAPGRSRSPIQDHSAGHQPMLI